MTSYQHRKTAEKLLQLEALKLEQPEEWLTSKFHLALLTDQFVDQEVVLYASTKHLFVHTVLAPVPSVNEQELSLCMDWSFNPYRARIYQYTTFHDGGETSSVADCMTDDVSGNFCGGKQILFNRFFDGDKESLEWEVLQELLHLLDLHHLPSRCAFCRIDKNGDYDDIISYSEEDGLKLVTMHRGALDWFAENIGTLTNIWIYPNQSIEWQMVSVSKLISWFLLMLLSFVLVSLIKPEANTDAALVK